MASLLKNGLPAPLRSRNVWLLAFLAWAALLFYLSHGDHLPQTPFPPIPHFDKVLHFGYFLGGGGLLAAYLFLKKSHHLKTLFLIAVPILSLIGIADEFHQSFFAHRSGNDPGDWLADTLGATAGVLIFWKLRHFLTTESAAATLETQP